MSRFFCIIFVLGWICFGNCQIKNNFEIVPYDNTTSLIKQCPFLFETSFFSENRIKDANNDYFEKEYIFRRLSIEERSQWEELGLYSLFLKIVPHLINEEEYLNQPTFLLVDPVTYEMILTKLNISSILKISKLRISIERNTATINRVNIFYCTQTECRILRDSEQPLLNSTIINLALFSSKYHLRKFLTPKVDEGPIYECFLKMNPISPMSIDLRNDTQNDTKNGTSDGKTSGGTIARWVLFGIGIAVGLTVLVLIIILIIKKNREVPEGYHRPSQIL